jgi:hypothetical protein
MNTYYNNLNKKLETLLNENNAETKPTTTIHATTNTTSSTQEP